MDELYSKLVCALMHNITVCQECKKCGNSSSEARMNLVRELANYMNKELPWEEE